jgi:hypothetical protein
MSGPDEFRLLTAPQRPERRSPRWTRSFYLLVLPYVLVSGVLAVALGLFVDAVVTVVLPVTATMLVLGAAAAAGLLGDPLLQRHLDRQRDRRAHDDSESRASV